MAKVDPNSKASRIRRAKALLEALLRAPKTRNGLVAASSTKGVSANFVYGWLSNAIRTGFVVVHKSAAPLTYQLASTAATERPSDGLYPAWLEPRALPPFTARTAYLDGEIGNRGPGPDQKEQK